MAGLDLLPAQYTWLKDFTASGPAIMQQALTLFGTKEADGDADNPVIVGWAKELGLASYGHDSIPWCGLFMAVVVSRASVGPAPAAPLWALDWENYGVYAFPGPFFADVLVFKRPGGGHVGLYVGEDDATFHVLGGNESNQVEITRISKLRMVAWRRPKYATLPANVKKVILSPEGIISQNEV